MFLVQILLPLMDNDNQPFPSSAYREVADTLTHRFGGLTAYTRAPAEGRWKDEGDNVARDQIVILEVMAEDLDRKWWAGYRKELERRFAQDVIIVRATAIDTL